MTWGKIKKAVVSILVRLDYQVGSMRFLEAMVGRQLKWLSAAANHVFAFETLLLLHSSSTYHLAIDLLLFFIIRSSAEIML